MGGNNALIKTSGDYPKGAGLRVTVRGSHPALPTENRRIKP